MDEVLRYFSLSGGVGRGLSECHSSPSLVSLNLPVKDSYPTASHLIESVVTAEALL